MCGIWDFCMFPLLACLAFGSVCVIKCKSKCKWPIPLVQCVQIWAARYLTIIQFTESQQMISQKFIYKISDLFFFFVICGIFILIFSLSVCVCVCVCAEYPQEYQYKKKGTRKGKKRETNTKQGGARFHFLLSCFSSLWHVVERPKTKERIASALVTRHC